MTITRAEALAVARTHMAGRGEWGASDCCAAACAAFADLWGVDPMGSMRGSYGSLAGALRTVRSFGGYKPFCLSVFGAAGLIGTDRPELGDLVFVPYEGPFGMILGLAVGGGAVAMKQERGFRVASVVAEGMTCRS